MSKKTKRKPKYIQAPTAEDLIRIENGEKFSDITAGPIKKAIDNALDEDIVEIEQFAVEPERKKNVRNKTSFRKRMYFSLGVFVSIMSVIGIIFSVNFCFNTIKKIADNTSQKNQFAQIIFPAVVVDPPTFSEGEKLPVDIMLTAAVWHIILNEDKSIYNSEYDYITVPASDVEVFATKLFGSDITFAHQTLGDPDLYFEYVESINSYILPISPHYLPYTPVVEDIKKLSADKFELKVGYNNIVNSWLPQNSGKPDKYMIYTLEKKGNVYILVSIKDFEISTTPIS